MMEAAYMADSVIRLTSLDHLPDRVNGTYDMVILGAFLNVVPISDIISFFKETYGLLNAKGVLYVSLLNYNSFEHVMENLPNDVPHLIYDSILPLNGERVFPVPRLVHALKKEFSNKSVWVGYGVQSHYFGDISLFEQTTNEILGTSDDLHYLLSGDIVALCIR